MRSFILCLHLAAILTRQTVCENEEELVQKDGKNLYHTDMQGSTLHYHYESEAHLFGPAEETFVMSADIDVEHIGDGFGDYLDKNASLFLMFMHRVFVQVIKRNGTASEDTQGPVSADDLYDQPTRFVQLGNGEIAEVRFTPKDLGDPGVMDFKRSIISAIQTRLANDKENVTETDVMGRHKSRYSSTKTQSGELEIKKHVSSTDMYKDDKNPSDSDDVDMELDEVQHVSKGVLTSVTGHVHVATKPEQPNGIGPAKAEDDDNLNVNLGAYLTSDTTFNLTLRRHVKRSAEGHKRVEAAGNAKFIKRSLKGEHDKQSGIRERWANLRRKFDAENKLNQAVENFFRDPSDTDQLNEVSEILSLENELGMVDNSATQAAANKPAMVKQLIDTTKEMVSHCSKNWDVCKEILDLYVTAGGKDVEKVLSELLHSERLSTEQKQELVQKLSFIFNPTKLILKSVKKFWDALPSHDSVFYGDVILTLGSLGSRDTAGNGFRSDLVALLRRHLEASLVNNNTDQLSVVLEAIGNFGDNRLTPDVLSVATEEGQTESVQIGCIHAVRRNLQDESVQKWLVYLLNSDITSCELRQAAVVTIKGEHAYRKVLDTENKAWPISGHTEVDGILSNALITNDEGFQCTIEDIKEYFEFRGTLGDIHGDTAGAANSTRARRGVAHRSCSLWYTYGGRYSELRSSSQFYRDNSYFPSNKHCLSHLSYGPSKANIYIKSGVFAGKNTGRGYCKVYGRSIAKASVFNRRFDLATAEAYRQNFPTTAVRVYLKVFGKTVINLNQAGALYKTYPVYRPAPRTLTVFSIYVYIARISVTVSVAPRIDFSIRAGFCARSTNPCSHCLTMTLKASTRITGGAQASLASLVRGGIDLNINLNYLLEGDGKLYPGICFRFYYGHDPMSVNLGAWYQIRSRFRIRGWRFWSWRWTWGSRKRWSPASLSWSLAGRRRNLLAQTGTC